MRFAAALILALLLPASAAAASLDVPGPDGAPLRFAATESPVMEPRLQARYPQLRTYAIRRGALRGRATITPFGLDAVVHGPGGGWSVGPDPSRPARPGRALSPPVVAGPTPGVGRLPQRAAQDIPLRTYRLALLNDPSYAAYFGVSDVAVLAAKVALVNRVNQLYNDDLAARFLLIDETETLNFDSAAEMTGANGPCGASPCFPAGAAAACSGATLAAADLVLGQLIGAADYDVGHVTLGIDGGGIAGLGVAGGAGKGRGCTGLPTPEGDFFAIDYLAHELGHQLGADHSFQGTTQANSNCSGANRVAASAVEPGSGSTVMAYAGICRTDDLQPHSDPYFSQRSIAEVARYVTPPATVDEEQSVALRGFDADGESFTLTYAGLETPPIVRGTNFTAAGIEAALGAVLPAGADVAITSLFETFGPDGPPGDGGFVVEFAGSLAGTDVAALSVTDPSPGVSGNVGEEDRGGAALNGGTIAPTVNDAPSVSAGPDVTIPARTPFTLTGTATDPQGDPLTYLWEQNDPGGAAPVNLLNNSRTSGPLFRVFGRAAEVTDAAALLFDAPGQNVATEAGRSRTFPDPVQIAAGNTNAATGTCPAFAVTPLLTAADVDPAVRECYSELLPTAAYADALHFRLTARDRRSAAGGVGFDDVTLALARGAGPFQVTAAAVGPGGLDVTWDVAGTNAAPVGTAAVRISLSYDGGLTFPTVLAESTPNDGAATVALPAGAATGSGRVKVEAVGNVFFDVSDTNLAIAPATAVATPTAAPDYYLLPGFLRPDLSKVGRRLRVDRRGRVALKVRCARVGLTVLTPRCTGSVQIAGRRVSLSFRIATTVRVRLAKRTLRTLKRRNVKTTVRATVRNPGAQARSASRPVTLLRRR